MKAKIDKIIQGTVWLTDFNPTKGVELTKTRPAVIVNGDFGIGLDLKIVAPITSWRKDFSQIWWLYKIPKSKESGLDKDSAVNCYQIRCVSSARLIKFLGKLSQNDLEEVIATVQNCVELS